MHNDFPTFGKFNRIVQNLILLVIHELKDTFFYYGTDFLVRSLEFTLGYA